MKQNPVGLFLKEDEIRVVGEIKSNLPDDLGNNLTCNFIWFGWPFSHGNVIGLFSFVIKYWWPGTEISTRAQKPIPARARNNNGVSDVLKPRTRCVREGYRSHGNNNSGLLVDTLSFIGYRRCSNSVGAPILLGAVPSDCMLAISTF